MKETGTRESKLTVAVSFSRSAFRADLMPGPVGHAVALYQVDSAEQDLCFRILAKFKANISHKRSVV